MSRTDDSRSDDALKAPYRHPGINPDNLMTFRDIREAAQAEIRKEEREFASYQAWFRAQAVKP